MKAASWQSTCAMAGVALVVWAAACSSSDEATGVGGPSSGGGAFPTGGGGQGPGAGVPDGGAAPFFDPNRSPICENGWCWENPYPHGEANRALWAAQSDDVWFAGDGPMLHFDGTGFAAHDVPDIGRRNGLWGASASAIWLVGSEGTAYFDGAQWSAVHSIGGTAVHGSGPNDVWVVGGPATQHWDGTSWTEPADAPAGTSVQVQDATSRWIFGSAAWHFTDNAWQEVAWPVAATAAHASAIEGDDLWVVAMTSSEPVETALFHGDGSSFEPVVLPLDEDEVLTSVWLAGPDDVWLTSNQNLWHGSAGTWTPGPWPDAEGWADYLRSPRAIGALSAVGGTSSSDLWAAGERGQILRHDGDVWRHLDTRLSMDGNAVWYDDSGLWFSPSGSTVARVDAEGVDVYELEDPEPLNALWGDGHGVVWGVGESGYIVRLRDGVAEQVRSGTGWWLYAIAGTSPDDIWTVGESETLLHWSGEQWLPDPFDFSTQQAFGDVATTDPDNVWITGQWYIDVWHWNGTEWAAIGGDHLDGISLSVPSPDCVWYGATDGEVMRYQQTEACTSGTLPMNCWSAPYRTPNWYLRDVYAPSCDEAWSVGEGGFVWHVRDGVEDAAQVPAVLHTIRQGPDGRLFIFGDDSVVLSQEQ